VSLPPFQPTSTPASEQHPAPGLAEPARQDAITLAYMLSRLRGHFGRGDAAVAQPPIVFLPERNGYQHRIVLLNNSFLHSARTLAFVGFFGRKRESADTSLLDALDAELIQELYAYPHMLSYSSLELHDGSWGNLVLMSSPRGAIDWAGSARHAYAAYDIAPACYSSIRLHNGLVTLDGMDEAVFQIQRTKHFNYAGTNG